MIDSFSFDKLPMLLSVEELMPVLRIGISTAYELVRSGQIFSIRVGRQFRIPKQAVLDFIQQPGRKGCDPHAEN